MQTTCARIEDFDAVVLFGHELVPSVIGRRVRRNLRRRFRFKLDPWLQTGRDRDLLMVVARHFRFIIVDLDLGIGLE